MKQKITVWRAMLQGECKQIGLTENSVRDLRGNAWYTARNHKHWHFTSEEKTIPVVRGRIVIAKRQTVDFDRPLSEQFKKNPIVNAPHIFWTCPYCGERHFTDIDSDDSPIGLWFCEQTRTDEMALVRWRIKGHQANKRL